MSDANVKPSGSSTKVDRAKRAAFIATSAPKIIKQAEDAVDKRFAKFIGYVLAQAKQDNFVPLSFFNRMKRVPVTIREFVEGADYIGPRMTVWPKIMEDLEFIFPDVWVGEDYIVQANLGGAAGIGKSTIIIVATLYIAYLFTCFNEPQKLFSLAPSTQIQLPIMCETVRRGTDLIYVPLRQIWDAMPYARKNVKWNKEKKATLEVEGNIKILPWDGGRQHLHRRRKPSDLLR